MGLTSDERVETLEEGGGVEEAPLGDSIDYFFSLLTEAALHVKELQKTVGKAQVDIAKLVCRCQDWIEFQEDAWGGAGGPAKAQLSLNGLKPNKETQTSTNRPSPDDGGLAGRSAAPSNGKGAGPKRRNK